MFVGGSGLSSRSEIRLLLQRRLPRLFSRRNGLENVLVARHPRVIPAPPQPRLRQGSRLFSIRWAGTTSTLISPRFCSFPRPEIGARDAMRFRSI